MEVVGVGASAIAFAQAAESIVKYTIKAKQFWEEIKVLPEKLNFLIEELKISETDLRNIEAQFSHPNTSNRYWDVTTAQQSVEHARRARDILENLTHDLNNKLSNKKGLKRKIALARISTKQGLLDQHEQRLESSLRHLDRSMLIFNTALLKQTPDLVVAKFTTELLPQFSRPQATQRLAIEGHDDNSRMQKPGNETMILPWSKASPAKTTYVSSRWGTYAMTYTKDTGAWQAYVQWPSWMSQKVYELQSSPTFSGWTYNFRTYNILPMNAEIFTRIRNCDNDGVLELLSSRKASPYDRDNQGYSLLYHAAGNENYETCQLLLKHGARDELEKALPTSRDEKYPMSPLSTLLHGDDRNIPSENRKKIIELFQSHLHDSDYLPSSRLLDYLNMEVWVYGTSHLFIFLDRFLPKYYARPLRSRLEAVRLGSFHMPSYTSLCRLLSKEQTFTATDVSLSCQEKISLVHSAALALGIRLADDTVYHKRSKARLALYGESWSEFVTTVTSVATTEDLHSIELVSPWNVYQVPEWRGTPLISAIGGALCYISPDIPFFHWDNVFQRTLQRWLEDIKAAGVDLIEYGKREQLLLENGSRAALDSDAIESSRNSIRETMGWGGTLSNHRLEDIARASWNSNHWVPIRIIDLKIGLNPTDWHILWAPEFEYMASQFWITIEKEAATMPGAWVDD